MSCKTWMLAAGTRLGTAPVANETASLAVIATCSRGPARFMMQYTLRRDIFSASCVLSFAAQSRKTVRMTDGPKYKYMWTHEVMYDIIKDTATKNYILQCSGS